MSDGLHTEEESKI